MTNRQLSSQQRKILKEAAGCIKSDSSFFKIPENNTRTADSSSKNNSHDGTDTKKFPNSVIPMLPTDVLLKNIEEFTKTDPLLKIASEPPVFKSTEDISSNAEALRMMAASFKEIVKIESDINTNAPDIAKGGEESLLAKCEETERKVLRRKRCEDEQPDLGSATQP